MSNPISWKDSSQAFFDLRASEITKLDFSALCYVSGRDFRLWSDMQIYNDMISDILKQTGVDDSSSLLEVGCASGFLAWGLAPRLGHYLGLDVAPRAVNAAQRLGLANAQFKVADGGRLPLSNSTVDAAICYDVFTNFPSFDIGECIIREMLRVVRPGGRVLIGSIPDGEKRTEYEKRVADVTEELNSRLGPSTGVPLAPSMSLLDRLRHWLKPITPGIVCYYFKRDDFLRLGVELGVSVEIADIHPMNPYVGYRFNAIFTKNRK